jgi:hypothetical protein
MSHRPDQLRAVQEEALALFTRKNADYGDAFANYGPVGVIMRMGDKIQRLMSITKTNVQMVDSESLRDTLIDLHNYAAMGVMLIDENSSSSAVASIQPDI